MQITTLLARILGLKGTRVLGCEFREDGLFVDVAPSHRVGRCSGCFCRVRQVYDARDDRAWRHLDLAGLRVRLRSRLRRLRCPRCGVLVEAVPWAETGSWFTREFEEHVGYLAQRTDKTTLSALMRVAWRTVGTLIERVVARHQQRDPLDGLTVIGVDELSYRRHHEYVTVVVDHVGERIVWARPGKDAATLNAFFTELGPERSSKLEAVTIDMSAAYLKAITEASPQAQVIFDRFHVQRLAHDAVDEVRRTEVRAVEDPDEKRALKHTRFALQKNPWNLTDIEREKLVEVQKRNRRLYRAYLLKETLSAILDRRQPNVAAVLLDDWIGWAARSRLAPFKKLSKTIRTHRDRILAYVKSRLNNGRTEGLNGKIRTITRRSYGFHGPHSLIALIFLCCGGITLSPVQR